MDIGSPEVLHSTSSKNSAGPSPRNSVGLVRQKDFEDFVREHSLTVRRYALSLTKNHWLAEDVSQETFLRAWRYWDSFRGDSTRQAWLVRICRNSAFDALAKHIQHDQLVVEEQITVDVGFQSIEIRQDLLALSLDHREIVVLIDLLGFDYATASEILDCKVGTVRSRLSRARQELANITRNPTERTA